MTDLMKQLDKLQRCKIGSGIEPGPPLGYRSYLIITQSRRGEWVHFEQVKTVVGQWVADNSDLVAAVVVAVALVVRWALSRMEGK